MICFVNLFLMYCMRVVLCDFPRKNCYFICFVFLGFINDVCSHLLILVSTLIVF